MRSEKDHEKKLQYATRGASNQKCIFQSIHNTKHSKNAKESNESKELEHLSKKVLSFFFTGIAIASSKKKEGKRKSTEKVNDKP